jgi:hypothetical protein
VFWLFLSQLLSADPSCRGILRKFLGWMALLGRSASGRTAGYCQGRSRLPQAHLDEAHRRLAHKIRSAHLRPRRWLGRSVKVVDGSGLSMPDTPSLQKLYPQPKGAKPGCSFPVMRVAALFCLGTGVLIEMAKGSLHVGERELFRSLWGLLDKGDVILADRGFCGFAEFHFLRQRGVDCVMRAHQRRTVGRIPLKSLGPGDLLVLWLKSKPGPRWPEKTVWDALPEAIRLREIAFRVGVKGFRVKASTVVTTLLDPIAFPPEAFAGLYRRRWQAELFLRDIKTTMGMDLLRCKSPAMVHKELTMHLIAYNLVRLTMLEAAGVHATPVERVSFKGTLATLRGWAPLFLPARRHTRDALWEALLRCLAADSLPLRPDRLEPRARKRRPKNCQLLNKPRRRFKEIYHRNKYTKVLS